MPPGRNAAAQQEWVTTCFPILLPAWLTGAVAD
jgi:hypothetical protein